MPAVHHLHLHELLHVRHHVYGYNQGLVLGGSLLRRAAAPAIFEEFFEVTVLRSRRDTWLLAGVVEQAKQQLARKVSCVWDAENLLRLQGH